MSVVISLFLFLILLIWILSIFFFLRSPAKGLLILFIFSRNHFTFIDICYWCLHFNFIYFCSYVYDSFLLLTRFLCSSSFSCFRLDCLLEILFCFIFWSEIECYKLPLTTAFAVSHRCWMIMFSLSFFSKCLFISSLISIVMTWLFSSALFSFSVFVCVCVCVCVYVFVF